MSGRLMANVEKGSFSLIAEIGVNYYDIARQRGISNMAAAKLMCLEAKNAGATAVKFQAYKAETIASKNSPSYWDTTEEATDSQYELFKKFDSFGVEEYRELAAYCNEIDVDFFATAFDWESADYLDSLMDVYKISSSDLTNLPFIRYQAAKEKPIIMSVGAANLSEMQAAVRAVREVNRCPLVLMHCVLEYPTPYEDANLRRIEALKREFPDCYIGYSDHCKPDLGADVIKLAYALGAKTVEKHFTLDKTLPGNDHYHAMDPSDMRNICQSISRAEILLGDPSLGYSEKEQAARLNARRSVVAARKISAGSVVDRASLTFKRPGVGMSPACVDEVVGSIAVVDIPEDAVITAELISRP